MVAPFPARLPHAEGCSNSMRRLLARAGVAP
jgi:hypothetical protein